CEYATLTPEYERCANSVLWGKNGHGRSYRISGGKKSIGMGITSLRFLLHLRLCARQFAIKSCLSNGSGRDILFFKIPLRYRYVLSPSNNCDAIFIILKKAIHP